MAMLLSKKELESVKGSFVVIGKKPFVLVPAEVVKNLIGARSSTRIMIPTTRKGVPRGSVDAEVFMRNSIAADLKSAREEAGFTQDGLGKRLRVSQARVSQAESGTVGVSLAYVTRVLKACGLPANWKPKKK